MKAVLKIKRGSGCQWCLSGFLFSGCKMLHPFIPDIDLPILGRVIITMIGIITARMAQRPIMTPSMRRFLSVWARNE